LGVLGRLSVALEAVQLRFIGKDAIVVVASVSRRSETIFPFVLAPVWGASATLAFKRCVMRSRLRPMILLFAFAVPSAAWSAEIIVSPGVGTLALAIAGAAVSGDTLLLRDGSYAGRVTVNKSVTIRPLNRATNAIVTDSLTIAGPGIKVTLQGLKFAADVDLTQAAAIRLLENEWTSGSINGKYYRSSDGDGSLVIVGNRFASGSSIEDIRSNGAYIAGNNLFNGYINTNAYAWIVGNQVRRETVSNTGGWAIGTGGSNAFILANRVWCSHGYSIYSSSQTCIYPGSAFSLIAGNIVEVTDTNSSYYSQTGIGVPTSASEATVLNNVVRGTSTSATRFGAAIEVQSNGARVAGNVVVDWVSNSGIPIDVNSFDADVTHNLCFNSTGGCPAGTGNLNANPGFVDLVDYKLNAGSPAINTGPPDAGLGDLNRTRNDMGVHGGPWAIAQYDIQRAPNRLAPYVYPLFNPSTYLSGGILEVQALAVARLR
jgi:hypothetical protein